MYSHVRIDVAGPKTLSVHVERQDLDEMLGNLIENAAKYGGGSVFVTVGAQAGVQRVVVNAAGCGSTMKEYAELLADARSAYAGSSAFADKVRDVAEIYGGTVSLEESEDLGGLLVRLRLPAAT